jgi:dipicolinate synthase subunit B
MGDTSKIGFAICGSFCTFNKVIPQIKLLKDENIEIFPIMSETAYATDTRFGKAADFILDIEQICGKKIIHTIVGAEPIGPNALLDALIIAPCTGNTIAKLALGITDTSVTMAAKAHLRNNRPVLIAVSTNDALGANAKNLGILLNTKNIYFVPYMQDDSEKKPTSLVADMNMIRESLTLALKGIQIQPMIINR